MFLLVRICAKLINRYAVLYLGILGSILRKYRQLLVSLQKLI